LALCKHTYEHMHKVGRNVWARGRWRVTTGGRVAGLRILRLLVARGPNAYKVAIAFLADCADQAGGEEDDERDSGGDSKGGKEGAELADLGEVLRWDPLPQDVDRVLHLGRWVVDAVERAQEGVDFVDDADDGVADVRDRYKEPD
jgi:hypothetical protein